MRSSHPRKRESQIPSIDSQGWEQAIVAAFVGQEEDPQLGLDQQLQPLGLPVGLREQASVAVFVQPEVEP